MVTSLSGTLEFAKVLMTIFVMGYAYFFLRNAENYEEKRPWQYLYIASMFLFTVEVISTLQLFQGGLFQDPWFNDLKEFMEFGFISFFLFSFIYQHHLLLQRGVLVIEDKTSTEKEGKGLLQLLIDKYKDFEEKYIGDDEEGPSPEEELQEEMEELDEDEELKKEEDELDKIVK